MPNAIPSAPPTRMIGEDCFASDETDEPRPLRASRAKGSTRAGVIFPSGVFQGRAQLRDRRGSAVPLGWRAGTARSGTRAPPSEGRGPSPDLGKNPRGKDETEALARHGVALAKRRPSDRRPSPRQDVGAGREGRGPIGPAGTTPRGRATAPHGATRARRRCPHGHRPLDKPSGLGRAARWGPSAWASRPGSSVGRPVAREAGDPAAGADAGAAPCGRRPTKKPAPPGAGFFHGKPRRHGVPVRTPFDQGTGQARCLPRASPHGTPTTGRQRRLFRVSRNGGAPAPRPAAVAMLPPFQADQGASSHEGRQGREAPPTIEADAREGPVPERQATPPRVPERKAPARGPARGERSEGGSRPQAETKRPVQAGTSRRTRPPGT
ncbi:hypothetical protein ABIE41_000118 [Bosea sp. OAE506]